jgi:hypothetical protein
MAEKKHHRTGDVTARILGYMGNGRLGQNVNIEELVEATGLEKSQVQSAMSRLVGRYGMDVTTVVRGNVYRLNSLNDKTLAGAEPEPTKPSSPNMYEEVGVTQNDSIVVRGEDGTLYRLAEL